MRTAVLLLLFNRPDTTVKVLDTIRQARPERLYLAADGPRADREGEAALCQEAREIATAVDWPCEVRTRFLDENQGCERAVSGAITWFFECEPEGIIVEDDCLPDQTFFPYCEELLEKYRNEPSVMSIAGTIGYAKHLGSCLPISDSFVFSKHVHLWGWATWRRAWQLYDVDMTAWPAFRDAGKLRTLSSRKLSFETDWKLLIDRVYRDEIDTWDMQWIFAHWLHGGVSCVPKFNLVSNIGFRPDATHTQDGSDYFAYRPSEPLPMPIKYPATVELDQSFENLYDGEDNSRPVTLGSWFRATSTGQFLVNIRRSIVGS